ncbi:MAG: hypothetical protein KatS3mg052_1437 [Candidatus Roseilinea sp.]|nr:MAG: hypothetical protein KatS3mg052_1437 [Candidatus Roseilinea sp.]
MNKHSAAALTLRPLARTEAWVRRLIAVRARGAASFMALRHRRSLLRTAARARRRAETAPTWLRRASALSPAMVDRFVAGVSERTTPTPMRRSLAREGGADWPALDMPLAGLPSAEASPTAGAPSTMWPPPALYATGRQHDDDLPARPTADLPPLGFRRSSASSLPAAPSASSRPIPGAVASPSPSSLAAPAPSPQRIRRYSRVEEIDPLALAAQNEQRAANATRHAATETSSEAPPAVSPERRAQRAAIPTDPAEAPPMQRAADAPARPAAALQRPTQTSPPPDPPIDSGPEEGEEATPRRVLQRLRQARAAQLQRQAARSAAPDPRPSPTGHTRPTLDDPPDVAVTPPPDLPAAAALPPLAAPPETPPRYVAPSSPPSLLQRTTNQQRPRPMAAERLTPESQAAHPAPTPSPTTDVPARRSDDAEAPRRVQPSSNLQAEPASVRRAPGAPQVEPVPPAVVPHAAVPSPRMSPSTVQGKPAKTEPTMDVPARDQDAPNATDAPARVLAVLAERVTSRATTSARLPLNVMRSAKPARPVIGPGRVARRAAALPQASISMRRAPVAFRVAVADRTADASATPTAAEATGQASRQAALAEAAFRVIGAEKVTPPRSSAPMPRSPLQRLALRPQRTPDVAVDEAVAEGNRPSPSSPQARHTLARLAAVESPPAKGSLQSPVVMVRTEGDRAPVADHPLPLAAAVGALRVARRTATLLTVATRSASPAPSAVSVRGKPQAKAPASPEASAVTTARLPLARPAAAPRIQRATTAGEVAVGSPRPRPTRAQPIVVARPPDLWSLARQVYPILKRMLAVERERMRGF